MFKTISRLVMPVLLLVVLMLNVPLSHAAPQADVATPQVVFCNVDVVLDSATWIQGQGPAEGKLETLIEALVDDDLAFKVGGELFQMSVDVPKEFNQTIATVVAVSGSSVKVGGFVKEFDSGLLGIDDFGSTDGFLPTNCGANTSLSLVIDVQGRALLEGNGQLRLKFLGRPH